MLPDWGRIHGFRECKITTEHGHHRFDFEERQGAPWTHPWPAPKGHQGVGRVATPEPHGRWQPADGTSWWCGICVSSPWTWSGVPQVAGPHTSRCATVWSVRPLVCWVRCARGARACCAARPWNVQRYGRHTRVPWSSETSHLPLGGWMPTRGVLVTGWQRERRVLGKVLVHHLFFLHDPHPEHEDHPRTHDQGESD